MKLRKYRSFDCPEMARLFYDTIHSVNSRDYTQAQLNAWADGNVDIEAWNRSFTEHETIVAVDGERIVGFGDMDGNGYLDRLYVHRDYQGQSGTVGEGPMDAKPEAYGWRRGTVSFPAAVHSPRLHHGPSLF